MLYVDGAPFLNGETKEMSKKSLTKKYLCKKHNEQLSDYNSEAIDEAILANLVYSKPSIYKHVKITIGMTTGDDLTINQVASLAPLYIDMKTVGIQVELYGVRIPAIFCAVPIY